MKRFTILTLLLVVALLCITVGFQFNYIQKVKKECKVDLTEYYHIDQDTLEQIFNSDGSIK